MEKAKAKYPLITTKIMEINLNINN